MLNTVGTVVLLIATILTIRLALFYRRERDHYRSNCSEWELHFAQRQNNTQQVVNGAELIRIDRNGRLNTFTFQRSGHVFQIETMGLLGDQPAEWRRLAGLDQ